MSSFTIHKRRYLLRYQLQPNIPAFVGCGPGGQNTDSVLEFVSQYRRTPSHRLLGEMKIRSTAGQGVRLCWELSHPKGPQGDAGALTETRGPRFALPLTILRVVTSAWKPGRFLVMSLPQRMASSGRRLYSGSLRRAPDSRVSLLLSVSLSLSLALSLSLSCSLLLSLSLSLHF